MISFLNKYFENIRNEKKTCLQTVGESEGEFRLFQKLQDVVQNKSCQPNKYNNIVPLYSLDDIVKNGYYKKEWLYFNG
jgi:hypothetical protein